LNWVVRIGDDVVPHLRRNPGGSNPSRFEIGRFDPDESIFNATGISFDIGREEA